MPGRRRRWAAHASGLTRLGGRSPRRTAATFSAAIRAIAARVAMGGAAQVRQEHGVRALGQPGGHPRLVLVDVQPRPGDPPGPQRLDQRRLVHDRPARRVDQVRRRLHHAPAPAASIRWRVSAVERDVQADEVALRQQVVERHPACAQGVDRGARAAAVIQERHPEPARPARRRPRRSAPARPGRASGRSRRRRACRAAPSPGTARRASRGPPRRRAGRRPGSRSRPGRPSPRSGRRACSSPGCPAGSPPPRRCCYNRPPCWRRPGSPAPPPAPRRRSRSVSRQSTASQPATPRPQLLRARARGPPGWSSPRRPTSATRLGPGSGIGWVMKTRPGTARGLPSGRDWAGTVGAAVPQNRAYLRLNSFASAHLRPAAGCPCFCREAWRSGPVRLLSVSPGRFVT